MLKLAVVESWSGTAASCAAVSPYLFQQVANNSIQQLQPLKIPPQLYDGLFAPDSQPEDSLKILTGPDTNFICVAFVYTPYPQILGGGGDVGNSYTLYM